MTHGIKPVEYRVLLKVDEMEDTITTKGGVVLYKGFESEADRIRKEAKEEKATVVALAENACEEWPEADRLKVGDRVIIEQFGGRIVIGQDGEKYRLAKDSVIEAIINY